MAFTGKEPLVTVVIPTFDSSDTLSRAFQSVINQTYEKLEILVVDDGSTDGTKGLVRSFTDLRIRYLRHDYNLGVAAARNTGVREAKGHYVAFLDSDDEWMNEKIAIQIGALLETGERVIAGCTGSYTIRGDHAKANRPPRNGSWYKRLLMKCGLHPGSTLMACKTAFERVGLFDEQLSRLEDWDWLLRYAESFPLVCLDRPLVRVYVGRRPKASVVESSTKYFVKKHRRKFYSFGTWYGRKAMSYRFQELGHHWYREGNLRKGSFYVLKVLVLNPFQKPMFYLALLDSIFDTHIGPLAIELRQKLNNVFRIDGGPFSGRFSV